ncbi:AAA family ATPase [Pseudohalioglobus sediminis]|uniref:AAA family ATPase n=1 Tax=Pseudohalioglobus sediminis TaxID=2606449 RepID=A0A5B0X216_9GAMM|nr:AAA family ATPase [Pseudohalioglobus sediminis]KAA1192718.1 AAA family ATPase [Pseudohalioglobus sediminis]
MPRFFLKRLKVEGFRGVNNQGNPLDINFKPDAVNSVFAVNGIGKSSIFESLYYAIHGTIPKLDDLKTHERPQEYYCNRFHSDNNAIIEIELEPDDGGVVVSILVKRDAAGNRTVSSPSGHTDPESFLDTLKESFALLDYRTFSRFIEESPLERGRTFSALLGLSEYSDCRQALQVVSDTRTTNTDLDMKVLATQIAGTQRTIQQTLAALRINFEKVAGKPLEDVGKLDQYASEVLQALGNIELLSEHFDGKALDDIDFDAIKDAIKTAEGGEKRKELEAAIADISALEALGANDSVVIGEEQEKIKELIDERDGLLAATRGDLFEKLYSAAQDVVESDEWSNDAQCPLCESGLESSISAHIKHQLTQYADSAAKTKELDGLWEGSAWRQRLSDHELAEVLGVKVDDRILARLDTRMKSGELSEAEATAAVTRTNELTGLVSDLLENAREKKANLEAELPASLVQLTEQVEYGRQFKEALAKYKQGQSEEAEQQARLDIRERWKTFISNTSSRFAAAEAALSKGKINDIDTEYKFMYKDIMQVGDVVPDLQRADDKEDLNVELSDFHGQHNLSARALLSESYRNALAISVFLAAAMKNSGAPRFIVLDDVTSSFDAGHQFYLMELIRTKLQHPQNADGLQFIILSHDGLLEKYFDTKGGTADWHHNKLQGCPPMGDILHQAQGADRLKTRVTTLLSAGQVSEAEPIVRQYLEYKLQQIIRKVKIPVPLDFAIKDTNKMVSNCLDAIREAFDLHQRAGTLVLEAQQVQDVLNAHVPAIVSNWVSHYATGGSSSFSAPVLNGVINSIEAMSECFRYDDTSSSPTVRRWYRSLSEK